MNRINVISKILLSIIVLFYGMAAAGNVPVGVAPWTHGAVTLDDTGASVLIDTTAGIDEGYMLKRSDGSVQASFSGDPGPSTYLIAKNLPSSSPWFSIFTLYDSGQDGTMEIGALKAGASPINAVRLKIRSGPNPFIDINPDLTDVDTSIYGTEPDPIFELDASENSVTITDLNITGSVTFTGRIVAPKDGNLTIVDDTVTIDEGPYYRVETEALAATDNLCYIEGGIIGQELYLTTVNAARDVTILDGGGCNTDISGARVLNHPNDLLVLYLNPAGVWLERSFSNNH